MKQERHVDEIARDCCMDYIASMSMALAEEKPDQFDLFHDFYKSAVERVRRIDIHATHQMDKLVAKLYERRQEITQTE